MIAVGMALMSVGAYAFTMIAARLLGPVPYGGFAALMNLLLVCSVASLALQAAAARRISADPAHVHGIARSVLGLTHRVAWGFGLLLLLAAPVINRVLRLDDLAATALVAAAVVPWTLMGAQAGVLQGQHRWRPLALVYAASGVPRLLLGTALLWWRPETVVAMVAVVVGCWIPVAVGWWAVRDLTAEGRGEPEPPRGDLVRETLHNSQALVAFLALSNLDIVVARNVLDAHDAGLYAAGLIVTKAVLFLPQFVVVVSFPLMATASRRRRALLRGLGTVTGLGVVAVIAAYVLSPLALVFVGGPDFTEIRGSLWIFAIIGTALALLQLLVYSVLARQGRRSVLLAWAGLAVLALLGSRADSITELAVTVAVIDLVVVAAITAVSLRVLNRSAPERGSPAAV